ncbi:MAG: RNA polymerase subunit sigma-24 [Pirellulaceae bacterium]|nr:MAG: RNA polymerase subunit sigma-24 [Pirellulaceae bacterium]
MTSPSQQDRVATQDPAEWVDAYADRLYRYAMVRLGDPHAAEEVVQETFLAAVESQDQFRGDGPVAGWLMTILRRKIIDWFRQRQRQPRQADASQDFDQWLDAAGQLRGGKWTQVDPAGKIELRELWQIVQQCLQRLPATLASVFVLHALEHMDSQQICKELEISPSNYWVRMHRARLQLAQCVAEKWEE